MLVWFAVLALLGLSTSCSTRQCCWALEPVARHRAARRAPVAGFRDARRRVSGGDRRRGALRRYGPFRPHPLAPGLYLVLPALVLNYFGQGALLLSDPAASENPFYRLAPGWGLYPLVVLASLGDGHRLPGGDLRRFSITRQAIQLGYLPRLRVLPHLGQEIGQVYVPRINTGLFVAIVILVIGFQTSDNLGAAYGIAVTGMMVITSSLAFIYMRSIGWSLALAAVVFGTFLAIDLIFLSANLLKITQGGWFPVLVAALIFAVMSTWWHGRRRTRRKAGARDMPLETFVER